MAENKKVMEEEAVDTKETKAEQTCEETKDTKETAAEETKETAAEEKDTKKEEKSEKKGAFGKKKKDKTAVALAGWIFFGGTAVADIALFLP